MRIEMSIECPLCGNDKIEIFYDKVATYTINLKEEINVYKCSSCDFVFLNPYPSEEKMMEIYEQYNNNAAEREADSAPSASHVFEQLMPEAETRVERLSKYIKGKNILEMGCSSGSFIWAAKNAVNSINGVEPCKENREHVKNFCGVECFNLIDDANVHFDTIAMFHLFEHMSSPHKFLNSLKTKRESGLKYLIIEVPCIMDPLVSLYEIEEFKKYYFQLQHPVYYSENTLRKVLEMNELNIIEMIKHQRYGLSNHITWLKTGKPGGNKKLEEIFKGIDNDYRESLIENGYSDALTVVAEFN